MQYLHINYNDIHIGSHFMKYIEYNEQKSRGTEDFPVEYYYVDSEHIQYVMPLHWHSELEFVLVRSGSLELYLDNVRYDLKKGDSAVIECGMLHRADPHDATYECIVLDMNMLRGKKHFMHDNYLVPIINQSISISPIFESKDIETSSAIHDLFDSMRMKHPYFQLDVYGTLFRIFGSLYRNGKISKKVNSTTGVKQGKAIYELAEWIDIHCAEHITLADLSQLCGFSEKYLCKIFKSYTSKTPVEYVNYLRINKICYAFDHSNITITEAAFTHGFNNLSYFSKIFRKYKGVTPSQYTAKRRASR